MIRFNFSATKNVLKLFLGLFFSLGLISLVFIRIGRLDVVIKARGVIETGEWVDVKPEVSGVIKEMMVEENYRVKQGDTLFKLEDSEKKAGLSRAKLEKERLLLSLSQLEKKLEFTRIEVEGVAVQTRARLASARLKLSKLTRGPKKEELSIARAEIARARIKQARAEAEYKEKLQALKQELALAGEVEEAKFRLDLADSELEIAEKNLRLIENRYAEEDIELVRAEIKEAEAREQIAGARKNELTVLEEEIASLKKKITEKEEEMALLKEELSKTVVAAPISGVVLTKDCRHLAGGFVREGETVIRIGNPSDYVVKVLIPERDRPKIVIGQAAKIFITPFPHTQYRIFEGKVTKISSTPVQAQGNVPEQFYVATVKINNSSVTARGYTYSLQPGFSAEVRVITRKDRLSNLLLEKLKQMKAKIVPADIHLKQRPEDRSQNIEVR